MASKGIMAAALAGITVAGIAGYAWYSGRYNGGGGGGEGTPMATVQPSTVQASVPNYTFTLSNFFPNSQVVMVVIADGVEGDPSDPFQVDSAGSAQWEFALNIMTSIKAAIEIFLGHSVSQITFEFRSVIYDEIASATVNYA